MVMYLCGNNLKLQKETSRATALKSVRIPGFRVDCFLVMTSLTFLSRDGTHSDWRDWLVVEVISGAILECVP